MDPESVNTENKNAFSDCSTGCSRNENLPLLNINEKNNLKNFRNWFKNVFARSRQEKPSGKTRSLLYLWKDILILSLVCFAHNFGYFGVLFNINLLQGDNKYLVSTTLTVLSAAEVLGSFFVPSFLIRWLGCKIVLIIVSGGNLMLSIGQLYPSYFTLIPGAIYLGLSNLCIFVIIGTYTTTIGQLQVEITGHRLEITLGWLFGFVNMLRYSGGFASNLFVYIMLNSNTIANVSANYTLADDRPPCGASYCNEPLTKVRKVIPEESKTSLYIIFIIFASCGPFISLFLKSRDDQRKKFSEIHVFDECKAMAETFKNSKLLLLLLFFFNRGFFRGFIVGDYENAFILCALEPSAVSLSSTTLNGVYLIMSMMGGLVITAIGIRSSILLISSVPIVLFAYLTYMDTNMDGLLIAVMIIAAGGGAFLSLANLLAYTIVGLLFKENKESAHSINRMIFGVGSCIVYLWSGHTCLYIKLPIYILIGIMGFATFAIVMKQVTDEELGREKKKDIK